MTEYIFRLSDETPKIEVDVKAAAIINGVGQDLYDRTKKELGFTGTFEEFLTKFKGERGDTGAAGAKGDTGAAGAKGDTGLPGKSATVTIGTVTTGETASVTNTGTESAAVLNFVLPAGGGQSNGLHTEIKTVPVTVNAQSIQTVEFEAKFTETPTLHGLPALMGAGENRFLYLLSVDKNGFTCRSNYFSAGVQTIHYAVTGKLA
nr:MAG TPA: collagen alpha 1(VIII) chain protein [Caudoviricetes sp.]